MAILWYRIRTRVNGNCDLDTFNSEILLNSKVTIAGSRKPESENSAIKYYVVQPGNTLLV